jgi:hypothetical protein
LNWKLNLGLKTAIFKRYEFIFLNGKINKKLSKRDYENYENIWKKINLKHRTKQWKFEVSMKNMKFFGVSRKSLELVEVEYYLFYKLCSLKRPQGFFFGWNFFLQVYPCDASKKHNLSIAKICCHPIMFLSNPLQKYFLGLEFKYHNVCTYTPMNLGESRYCL